MKGSRGAGFSISIGVQTKILVEPSERDVISVVMNGRVTGEAFVSENTVRRMLAMAEEPQRVEVIHEIETPIGAGYGSSGGGALTIALAMNEALGLGLSYVDASKVAHLAEIECKTGLGTVFAATQGGFGVLYKPGAPGIGEAIKYDRSEELTAFCVHFGPISTREALSDLGLRRRINDLGGNFVDEIKGNLSPSRFMELSREFTDYVGITTPRLKVVLDAADKAGVPCSMAMFGEALFSLVEKDEAGRVAEFYRRAVPDQNFRALSIDERSAHLL
jgi:pantoate kinase